LEISSDVMFVFLSFPEKKAKKIPIRINNNDKRNIFCLKKDI